MSEDLGVSAPAPGTHRKRNVIIATVLAVILVTGGIATSVAVADANARAEEQAAADAAAEAARQEGKAEHATALREAEAVLLEGWKRYDESEAYGDAEKREELKAELDALEFVLGSMGYTTRQLKDAKTSVDVAMLLVGSEEQREEELASAADKALDEKYLALAKPEGTNEMYSSTRGRDYCEELKSTTTPDAVIASRWNSASAIEQINDPAVRVYCTEFARQLDLVLSGFFDGNHVVGQTIKAGTYRTVGAVSDCYWERNDGTGDILDNNFVTSAHKGVTVTLNAGEGFTSCLLYTSDAADE